MNRDMNTIHEHYRLWTIFFVITVLALVLCDPFLIQIR